MAGYALALAVGGAESSWVVGLTVCLQALYMVVFFRVILPIVSEIGDARTEDLDERQVGVRDRAHRHAYQKLGVVITLITTAPLVAFAYFGVDSPLELNHWHFLALFFFFMNLGISLPTSVIAWTEPDPVEYE
jgi:hypothetical protein